MEEVHVKLRARDVCRQLRTAQPREESSFRNPRECHQKRLKMMMLTDTPCVQIPDNSKPSSSEAQSSLSESPTVDQRSKPFAFCHQCRSHRRHSKSRRSRSTIPVSNPGHSEGHTSSEVRFVRFLILTVPTDNNGYRTTAGDTTSGTRGWGNHTFYI